MTAPEHAPTVLALYETICVVVCAKFRVTPRKLLVSRSRGRGGPGFARQVAMYLLRTHGVSFQKVGELFGGRSLSTVSHACATVEDARDDPAIDGRIDEIESAVHRRIKASPATSVSSGS